MARTAIAHFGTRRAADEAYDELVQRGFSRDDISIIGHGSEGEKGLRPDDDHVSAGQGAAVGGVTGLLLGAAAMLIPGIGPIVAVGPLAAALAGAVTGGVTGAVVGGVTGALIDAGVDEDTAKYYDERLRQGGVIVTAHTSDSNYDDARLVLERHGGDIGSSSGAPADAAGTTGYVDRGAPGPNAADTATRTGGPPIV